jgi:hypothetical protein
MPLRLRFLVPEAGALSRPGANGPASIGRPVRVYLKQCEIFLGQMRTILCPSRLMSVKSKRLDTREEQ